MMASSGPGSPSSPVTKVFQICYHPPTPAETLMEIIGLALGREGAANFATSRVNWLVTPGPLPESHARTNASATWQMHTERWT